MKKKLLNQLVAVALVCGTILAVPANAETKSKNEKKAEYNWVMEKNQKWHCYNDKNELIKNTTISDNGIDYKIDANGDLILDTATLAKIQAKNTEEKCKYGASYKFENNACYYLDTAGQKTGWVSSHGKVSYYKNGELQKDTTVKDFNGKDVKLSKNGFVVGEHGYELLYGEEVTYDSSETYKKSDSHWKKTGDNWTYNFNDETEKDADLATDWNQINGVWYYFNDKGVMQKNTTVKDEKGNDCVLNADGALTNRAQPEFDNAKTDSEAVYTKKEINGKTYYVNNKGETKAGWIMAADHKWYYCTKDGQVQKNTTIIEGNSKYVLGSDGSWLQ